MAKLIRERFSEAEHPFAAEFVSSIGDDEKIVPFDLRGSRAHAKMLAKVGLLTSREHNRILRALRTIQKEWEDGKRKLRPELEDVHMNVEKWLTQLAGTAGEKIHTGRSRNDQVALDLRLYVRAAIGRLREAIRALRKGIVNKASDHVDAILPGYTHLQRAQPILFAHALLSFHEMVLRDEARLADALRRVNVSPLGAGAMAGTSLPIDPKLPAREMGFDSVFANSIDAVGDRDFAVEFVSACAILQTHLSQIAENLLLWSSAEFGFIELPDALCTSSSIMPQKKNADMIELVRGKTGKVVGNLVDLLTTLKALPMGYNRDLQETKPPVFDAAETACASVHAVALAIAGMEVQTEPMRRAAADPALLATDVAEYLVSKGVPFRQAHRIVARIVKEHGSPAGLPLSQLRKYSGAFSRDLASILSPESSIRRRRSPGGTGADAVRRRLARLRRGL